MHGDPHSIEFIAGFQAPSFRELLTEQRTIVAPRPLRNVARDDLNLWCEFTQHPLRHAAKRDHIETSSAVIYNNLNGDHLAHTGHAADLILIMLGQAACRRAEAVLSIYYERSISGGLFRRRAK